MQLQPHHSALRPWVYTVLFLTAVCSIIFAVLTGYTYKAFLAVVDAPPPTAAVGPADWQSLFQGCATSAAFGFVITIAFLVMTLALMFCSLRSLAHKDRLFARAVVMTASACTGLHILNITLQFTSFSRLLSTLAAAYQTTFNGALLMATEGFGITAFLLYVCFASMLLFWKDLPDTYQLDPSTLPHSSISV
ncbi:MAG: hypothetical protein WDW38_009064 [Sanguina aurantia]